MATKEMTFPAALAGQAVSFAPSGPLSIRRKLKEPGQRGWRRFMPFLFVYMTFEGLLRRSLPQFNLEVLLLKDAGLLLFYTYFLLCVYPSLPAWRSKDRPLQSLVVLFVAVNAIGLIKTGRYGLLPMLLGLKANFWYVPIFFIGRRYFTSNEQIRHFWRRLAWLLIPVLAVAVWQVFFGSFTPYLAPTGTVDAARWAAAGSGSLRNNTDGTLIATVASTFYGARLAVFAAIWILLATALCITEQTKGALMRLPYLYVAFFCALIAVFVSANRTAVGLSALLMIALVAIGGIHRSLPFLARLSAILLLGLMVGQTYRALTMSDAVEGRFRSFASFFSGLLDGSASDVHGSRYSVIGSDIVHGIELSLAEVGPFGRGLGLITQGAVYIDADSQPVFDVQRGGEAQADSQWIRLTIELGIPGILLYLAIAGRLLWQLVRAARRVRRHSWIDGITASVAPLLLLLYLGFAHKHAGFAVDPMFQCYVYFVAGAAMGVGARFSSESRTFRRAG